MIIAKDVRLAIVIPTRNRPDFIRVGLASITRQRGELPVTVFVSDNSDEAQAPLVAESVRVAGAGRAAYCRPPEILPMVEHWNWAVRAALEQTRCTHFTVLTDRGFYRRGALGDLLARITEHENEVVSFSTDTILDYRSPVTIGENAWTGSAEAVASAKLLRETSLCRFSHALPKLLNCAVPAALAREVWASEGHLCPPTLAPDFGAAFEILARRTQVIYFDKPLTVGFGLWRSNGTNLETGRHQAEAVRDFFGRGGAAEAGLAVPVAQVVNASNAIVHEYLCARVRHPGARFPELSLPHYLEFLDASLGALDDRALRRRWRAILRTYGLPRGLARWARGTLNAVRRWVVTSRARSFASTQAAIEYAYEHYPA